MLKISELRKVLDEAGVEYPPDSSKAVLFELVDTLPKDETPPPVEPPVDPKPQMTQPEKPSDVKVKIKGRKYKKKTCYEDGQVPLHICNSTAKKVAEGLKQQKHDAFIRYAKKLIAAEEK